MLHTDASLLPRSARARSSWNYLLDECDSDASRVQVSYHMNRLQRLDEPVDYLVTLNASARIDDDAVLARMSYTHPIYTPTSVAAQAELPALNDGRIAFAGAYQGWGFHEDGCASACVASLGRASLGVVLVTALYTTTIEHERRTPLRHRFHSRHTMWLIDLDAVPRVPRVLRTLATFDARDHFGDPDATLRANVDAYLAEHGIDLRRGRVRMLCNPRSVGYVFNPLTVYWCDDEAGTPVCVIAEVHNTYGGRHCYLVRPDAAGRAAVDKDFFVSPFFPVDGRYEMRFSEPGEKLEVSITLRRGENMEPVFRAKLAGHRTVARVRSVSRAAARHACGSWKVIALIRWQGIRLWLRRVPLVPRPAPCRNGLQAHPGG